MADNEPSPRPAPPDPAVDGFVVGHHLGVISVDVCRRIRATLGPDDAYRLGLQLMWAADLARLETP